MLKEMKEEVAFAFRLPADCGVGNTGTSAAAASAALMGGEAVLKQKFNSVWIYIVFSLPPEHSGWNLALCLRGQTLTEGLKICKGTNQIKYRVQKQFAEN